MIIRELKIPYMQNVLGVGIDGKSGQTIYLIEHIALFVRKSRCKKYKNKYEAMGKL